MLNTQSCSVAALIWAAIAAICARALWSLFAWPGVPEMLVAATESAFAGWLARNDVMVTGLAGFGGLAVAYLLNGWRDRAERRHAAERAERRLAQVLAREAQGIAAALAAAASDPFQGSAQVSRAARVTEVLSAGDHLVLTLPMSETSRLGAGATEAIRNLRQSMRSLAALTSRNSDLPDQSLIDALAAAHAAANGAARILDTLDRKGTAAADRLRLLPDTGAAPLRIDAPDSPRLLPAA